MNDLAKSQRRGWFADKRWARYWRDARRKLPVRLKLPGAQAPATGADVFTINFPGANPELPYGDMVEDATNFVRELELRAGRDRH
jgi:hypothetical protein